jgi:hypothetical protein
VTLLALKLLLSPLCVVAVSAAGRRWGIAAAGVLGGLPVVTGPILLVETLLHGRGFGGDAAAGTLLGLRLLPTVTSPLAADAPPWWDLPARALAALALVLVLVLTALSGALGPHLSGLLAPFPILTSVLAVFTHAHGGDLQVAASTMLTMPLPASPLSSAAAGCSSQRWSRARSKPALRRASSATASSPR